MYQVGIIIKRPSSAWLPLLEGLTKGLENVSPAGVGRRPTASAVARSLVWKHQWAQRTAAANEQWS